MGEYKTARWGTQTSSFLVEKEQFVQLSTDNETKKYACILGKTGNLICSLRK